MSSNEKQDIKHRFDTIIGYMREVEEAQELMREQFKDLKNVHGISPKTARKVAKIYHNANKDEYDNENQLVQELYDRIR